jgi:hypothetical protein
MVINSKTPIQVYWCVKAFVSIFQSLFKFCLSKGLSPFFLDFLFHSSKKVTTQVEK